MIYHKCDFSWWLWILTSVQTCIFWNEGKLCLTSSEMCFCHSRHFADRSFRNFRWCLLQIALANCIRVRQARLSYVCTEQGGKSHCWLPAFKARDACLLHVLTACTPERCTEMINRKTDIEENVSQGVPPRWGKGNLQMFRLQHLNMYAGCQPVVKE